ncbi:MAG: CtsR family transcriptional regulator [Oscillospiraceae bacterium]|jgi:transcriptional regulator CtsR|nr:CtsR family transcriptional regulator [Oscillospiraceae bacterium]
MKPLSDDIEAFIKSLLGEDQDQVDVQRNELAGYFRCAPSQITYVLSTRFTPDRGYAIESRRGGGGFVRIVRLRKAQGDQLFYLINQRIGASVSAQDAFSIIQQLAEQGILSDRESALMQAATSARAINLPLAVKDALRASVLREMLLQVVRDQKEA